MLIERELYINQIKNAYHILPVTILIGCRQVGKTSLLYMIKKELEHVFLNGQDPEVSILFESVSSIETYLRVNLNEHYKGFDDLSEWFRGFIESIVDDEDMWMRGRLNEALHFLTMGPFHLRRSAGKVCTILLRGVEVLDELRLDVEQGA